MSEYFCPFKPSRGWYVIKRKEISDTTKGGIALPDSHVAKEQGKVQLGLVLAAGEPRLMHDGSGVWPMAAKEGDIVVITEHGGKKVEFGEGDDKVVFWFYNDNDILGIVKEEYAEE